MSFRIKTILAMTGLSLVPYVITMIALGTIYRQEFETRVRDNMNYQLGITVDRLEQSLQSLRKDLAFIASLDTMNDVLTGDLDRRITDLLMLKKEDLHLVGNFDVVNIDGNVVASSDLTRVGTPLVEEGLMQASLVSSFNDQKVGKLVVHYSFENLIQFLAPDPNLHYSLSVNGQEVYGHDPGEGVIEVQRPLLEWPGIVVSLEQNRDFALSILDNVRRSFLLALAIGTSLIAGIAYLLASHMVEPIIRLSETARDITRSQDYGKRVTVHREDEIGQLAVALNLMIAGMQGLIGRLKEEGENKLQLAQEKSRAEMLQNLSTKLSRYLSPQVFESIFSGEKDVTLTSSRKKLTVFFSDIVNFTGTTDQMESEDLTSLLNHYLREMTEIALQYGATIDKYVGDAIMIFFGDPHSSGVAEDARQCIEMAIAMQKRMSELQREWQKQGFTKPISIRVGIHTGYCTVGNFGTEARMDYTIIGSAVNLASRIEGEAAPGCIFISADTHLLVQDRFPCTPASHFTPKGFGQPIQLYQVNIDEDPGNRITMDEEGVSIRIQRDRLSEASKARLRQMLQDISV